MICDYAICVEHDITITHRKDINSIFFISLPKWDCTYPPFLGVYYMNLYDVLFFPAIAERHLLLPTFHVCPLGTLALAADCDPKLPREALLANDGKTRRDVCDVASC